VFVNPVGRLLPFNVTSTGNSRSRSFWRTIKSRITSAGVTTAPKAFVVTVLTFGARPRGFATPVGVRAGCGGPVMAVEKVPPTGVPLIGKAELWLDIVEKF